MNTSADKQQQKIVTSIRVDEGLWTDVRIEALKRKKKVSELLEEALKRYIAA